MRYINARHRTWRKYDVSCAREESIAARAILLQTTLAFVGGRAVCAIAKTTYFVCILSFTVTFSSGIQVSIMKQKLFKSLVLLLMVFSF